MDSTNMIETSDFSKQLKNGSKTQEMYLFFHMGGALNPLLSYMLDVTY